jgi:invasion protein IalB
MLKARLRAPAVLAAFLAGAGATLAQSDSADQPLSPIQPPSSQRNTSKPRPTGLSSKHIAVDSRAPVVAQPATTSGAQLPNGASSIAESYGDWSVDCRIENDQKICAISQAQGNRQTGRRSFAIELHMPRAGRADGTILMPFGLKLENGAALKLDDKDLGKGLRFSTCVPDGCLLPVSFPTVATDAMKTAKTLTVASLDLSTNDPVSFNVSLNGFAAALNRLAYLGK